MYYIVIYHFNYIDNYYLLSPEKHSVHSVMCSHCLSLIKNLPVPCTPCTWIRVSNIRVSNPGNKTLRIQLCDLTAWALSQTSLYPVLPVPGSESATLIKIFIFTAKALSQTFL